MEEQLKQAAKADFFEKQFASAFDKYLNEKRENTTKPYVENKNWKEYQFMPSYQPVEVFSVEGDDGKLHKAKWASLLKECAFYYDEPTLQEERQMRRTLQLRYDDLFD